LNPYHDPVIPYDLILEGSEAPFAMLEGTIITRRQFFDEARYQGLQETSCHPLINVHEDPYAFSLSLLGAWLMGGMVLLPPDRSYQRTETMKQPFQGVSAGRFGERQHPSGRGLRHCSDERLIWPVLHQEVLVAYTSGSTGQPIPHIKTFGMLLDGARLIDGFLGGTQGVTLISTVPQQHMYGLELSVLLPLFCGALLSGNKPFYPADIMAALDQAARPRALVTTPLHLKILLDSGLSMPPIDWMVSATAPLHQDLATVLERSFDAPLFEIYGCTEAGSLAGRRPSGGSSWRWFEGVRSYREDGEVFVEADHFPERIALQDELTALDSCHFTLEGRCSDLINIAGKRNSLKGLEAHFRAIEGLRDVALMIPEWGGEGAVARLVAFVVADETLTNQVILDALRHCLDPVFVPRRLHRVDRLPRNALGKMTMADLKALLDDLPKAFGSPDGA
jgi:acyl-coenzyme A synthetase/AMP-(fatty) acid ligase